MNPGRTKPGPAPIKRETDYRTRAAQERAQIFVKIRCRAETVEHGGFRLIPVLIA
jgi:hypothetical protein